MIDSLSTFELKVRRLGFLLLDTMDETRDRSKIEAIVRAFQGPGV